MVKKAKLGIIGGSGLYDIKGLKDSQWIEVKSPFGDASDKFYTGKLQGLDVVFLPRHGRGHIIPPDEINYRANIDAMKRLGVTDILSLSACGSFRKSLPPGTFVLVDQFIDRTHSRPSSFFGKGLVAHVSMAHPTCGILGEVALSACKTLKLPHHKGGTYVAMQGPQFSSLAESLTYKNMEADVIGMTNMPEAKLAREAEICYQTIAMVTDFDCWHPDHESVEVADIIQVLGENAKSAQNLVIEITKLLNNEKNDCSSGCNKALENAIITPRHSRDTEMTLKLEAVAGRIFKKEKECA